MELLITESIGDAAETFGRNSEPAPVAVATTNAEGEILAVNDAFAAMLRYRSRELIGQRLRVPASLHQRNQERYLTADGEELWVNVTATPVFGPGRAVEQIVWIFEEAVEERRYVDAQREQADRLTSLSRMAATIAHEFNNVLMGISPFVEVIRRGRSVETSLEHIGGAVKRGKRLTEEILRFTRSSQPRVEPFEVEPWIETIALEARSLVPPSCKVETFVQSSDLVIDGDARQLHQIFTNLVQNARDAMPDGGTLSIEVLRERPGSRLAFGSLDHPERYAHCIVRDTGCGMSAETLRQIYEPMFTTRRNGMGLGLSLVHQVVHRHGGRIFAESTEGEGTAFHIFLPLAANA
ncbi:MAG: two-component system sensor histidine kinase NtrB [Thermoanaerobaculia bacterium]